MWEIGEVLVFFDLRFTIDDLRLGGESVGDEWGDDE
jgi:hypothetical protein